MSEDSTTLACNLFSEVAKTFFAAAPEFNKNLQTAQYELLMLNAARLCQARDVEYDL